MAVAKVTFALNGSTIELTKGTDGVWTGTMTAPTATSGSNNTSGPGVGANATSGYYPGVVVVTDDAGNTTTVNTSDATWGDVLKLVVKETTAPVASITSPSAGAYLTSATPIIKGTITDSGSGVNPAAVYVQIDSGTAVAIGASNVTVSGSTASVSYTVPSALSEGEHNVTLYAVDYDGNTSNKATASFKVDTVPPTLNVTSPADKLITNTATLTVSGTTNDATSTPVTLSVKVGTGTAKTVTVGSDGSWSTTVSLSEGSNTITVTATDSAGQTTTVTRTVTLDTSAPKITKIELTENPTTVGATITIKVTVTD